MPVARKAKSPRNRTESKGQSLPKPFETGISEETFHTQSPTISSSVTKVSTHTEREPPTIEDRVDCLIKELRGHFQQGTLFALEKGKEIALLKQEAEFGQFEGRLEKEGGLKPRKAQRWMKAAEAFKGQFALASRLIRQAVYDLSTDDAWIPGVRASVLQRLGEGEAVTLADVTAMREVARQQYLKAQGQHRTGRAQAIQDKVDGAVKLLFPLLRSRRNEVIGILKDRHWKLVQEELLEALEAEA